jgi:hypothetical protein
MQVLLKSTRHKVGATEFCFEAISFSAMLVDAILYRAKKARVNPRLHSEKKFKTDIKSVLPGKNTGSSEFISRLLCEGITRHKVGATGEK